MKIVRKPATKGKTAKMGHKYLAKLLALMDSSHITAEQVKYYAETEGYCQERGELIGELPENFIRELIRPKSWGKVVEVIRNAGVKVAADWLTPDELRNFKELASLVGKITPDNRKKLADLMALADPGFVNKWLGDLLTDIMDPEWNNLIGQLDGYQAPTPKEAKQIAARVTAYARKPSRPSWTLRTTGKRLVTVESKPRIKAA